MPLVVISYVCEDPSQRISSIIKTETTTLKTKNLKTIDTSSDNSVTTSINPSPLKDYTRYNIHDGSSLPDRSNLFFLLWQQLLTPPLFHLRYGDQSLKINTN